MKKIKWNKIIPVIINLYIVISTLVVVIIGINTPGDTSGFSFFKPYTVDSNILLALVSVPLLVYEIKDFSKDEARLPHWSIILYFIGVTIISITFLVVTFFLTPTLASKGGDVARLYTNGNAFFHIINPIMGMVMYLFILDEHPLRIKHSFLPLIPFGIYATIYTNCVLTKAWDDFYGFTFGGKYWMVPIVLLLLVVVCFIVGLLINKLHNHLVFAHHHEQL